jgi:hypothetical protein
MNPGPQWLAPGSPVAGQSLSALRAVVQDTLREAVRGRWIWMSVAAALGVALVAAFARSLALTEEHDLALAVAAPLARLLAVLIVCLNAIASVTREQADRTLLLALAAPISRTAWLGGKTAGLVVVAVLTALILAATVLLFSPPAAALLAWTGTLALELAVMAVVAIAISLVLRQVPPAVCAVMAFYVLARDLHVVQLLARHAADFSDLGAAAPVVQAVALLFPRLDLFARTDWLLGSPLMAPALGAVAAQAAVYGLLAFCVAVIDLRRAQFS